MTLCVVHMSPGRYHAFKDAYEKKDVRRTNLQTVFSHWEDVATPIGLEYDLNPQYTFYVTSTGEYLEDKADKGRPKRVKWVRFAANTVMFDTEAVS